MKPRYPSPCIRPLAILAIGVFILLQLGGCGGGTNLASGGIVGTGGSAQSTQGAISALGSHAITVNGQNIATTGATVMLNGQPAADSALKIGMVVTVVTTRRPDGSMTVTSIEYHAEVQGVVTGVDPAAQTFTVLGQRVRTDRLTLYDGGAFDTLLNQVVEVSGFRATPGDLLATLVIVKPAVPPASATLQVTGVVGAFDGTTRMFAIGLQVFDYNAIAPASVPPTLATGTTVRVSGTQAAPTGPLFASSIAVVPATPPDVTSVEIEGLITDFSGIGNFKVNGQPTNASGAIIEGGTLDMIANGALVEVEGVLTAGILVATKLEIEPSTVIALDGVVQAVDLAGGLVTLGGQSVRVSAMTQLIDSSIAAAPNFSLAAVHVGDRLSILAFRDEGVLVATRLERVDLDAPPPSQPSTSIQGTISNFASVASFVVAGQQVNAGAATFVGGTVANLANGVNVTIDGTMVNGTLNASKVQFLPGSPGPGSITITGSVSGFVSVSNFTVAGQGVDASSASFSNGSASDLANGRNVTVKGTMQGATLVAQTVSFAQPPQTTSLEVEGQISNFVSVANFVVSGQSVNASQATVSNGTAGDLANGRKVQVKGPLQNGVLVATTVQIEDSQEPQEISVQGLITNFVSVADFTVAGRTVDASNTKFDNGTAADLANGRSVEVQGFLSGQVLKAKELEFH